MRVLEERKVRRLGGKTDMPVDVRVVAATNKVPEEAIKDKLLREDLYYRLNVFHIMLPPLRDRKEDIPAISEAITRAYQQEARVPDYRATPSALERFQNYSWPGNIRELRNVLERAAIMAGEGMILPKHLAMEPVSGAVEQARHSRRRRPQPKSTKVIPSASVRARKWKRLKKPTSIMVLQQTNNNKTKAADILGISVRTLHNRLGQLTNRAAKSAAI